MDRTTGARITLYSASSHIYRFCLSLQFMENSYSGGVTGVTGLQTESQILPSDEFMEETIPLFYFRKDMRTGDFLCVLELPPRLQVLSLSLSLSLSISDTFFISFSLNTLSIVTLFPKRCLRQRDAGDQKKRRDRDLALLRVVLFMKGNSLIHIWKAPSQGLHF